ncbi:MAG TPA: tetratricopeptide repeat protein, partial [Bacteroidales bacterium]|nr:tetratricopeptide repeat protein [Bacteroidales bacterium]
NPAFAEYDTVIRMDSNYVLAYFDRAISRYDLIRLIHSLDDYQEEITIGKKQSDLRSQLQTDDPQNTYENVIRDLTTVIRLDPDFSFAFYNRGFIYAQMGEYRLALEDFSSAISLRPEFPEAFYNRGLIRILQGEAGKGCEDLSRAGELGILDAYKVMKRYCFKDTAPD